MLRSLASDLETQYGMASWHANFSIGDWQVNPKLSNISKDRQSVSVKRKSMAVLVCLADANGEVVTRNEIMDSVWPGMAVTDDVLTQSIVELRKAFLDDARHPKVIETIPRLGFRLLVPVAAIDTPDVGSMSNAFPDSISPLDTGVASTAGSYVSGTARRYLYLAIAVVFASITFWYTLDEGGRKPTIVVQQPHTIAVLPFANMSDDPGNEYFSEGVSEDIRILLARIPNLKVIGRTSSSVFKGENADLNVIADVLGVETVVEGTVRKSGDQLRITAQLVDVSDGSQIWSKTYNRTMTDVFAVQDNVAAAIIDNLQIHVGSKPTRGRPTDNTEAYALFLKARASFSAAEPQDARTYLERAIELDPNFAQAYELLAFHHWFYAGEVGTLPEVQRIVNVIAREALAIDPDLPFAHALFEATTLENHSFLRQIEAFERAVREDPGNWAALDILCFYMLEAGYLHESLRLAERFVQLDPLSAYAYRHLVAAHLALGQTDEANEVLYLAEQLTPGNFGWLHFKLNLAENRYDIAIAKLQISVQTAGDPDSDWVREFVTSAREPATGQAYLDRRIPEILAASPQENVFFLRLFLGSSYQLFGYLDRHFEIILESDPGPVWTGSEARVWRSTMDRRLGFTAHPKYLEVAELLGLIDVWEQRGPPDFCEKVGDKWVCE